MEGDERIFYTSPKAPNVDEFCIILEECCATEIISHSDPRISEFEDAIKLELSGLMERREYLKKSTSRKLIKRISIC